MRLFIVSALLVAAAATPAMAAPLQHFSQDGQSYSYTASRQVDGVVVLNGTVEDTGESFHLRVRGTQVDGRLGMSNVAFRVSRETAAQLDDEVAGLAVPTTLAAN